jgi:RNA polymerase sigma-70 factor (ECF subfamily)
MTETTAFVDLLQRVRAGEQHAAAELVRAYEPAIRLEVRLRLRDRRLRRLFDSLDVCQSVLATFFQRAAAGQFHLEQPNDLLKLLLVIARTKVALHVRRALCPTRHPGAWPESDEGAWATAAPGPRPDELVADQELVALLRERLSTEERQLADLRAQDHCWADIAATVGGTPQARRRQLARAFERVLRELGLEAHDG